MKYSNILGYILIASDLSLIIIAIIILWKIRQKKITMVTPSPYVKHMETYCVFSLRMLDGLQFLLVQDSIINVFYLISKIYIMLKVYSLSQDCHNYQTLVKNINDGSINLGYF